MGEWRGAVARNVAALVVLSFVTSAGFSAVNLLIPYYLLALEGVLGELPERLGVVPAAYRAAVELGGLVTAFTAARSVFAAASGWLSDRLGRRPMIVLGAVLYTVAAVLYPFAGGLAWLAVLRGLQGVASALVWPVAEALLVDSVPAAVRTRALSLYVVSFMLGNVAGPALGAAAYRAAVALVGPAAPVGVFSASLLLAGSVSFAGLAASLVVVEPGSSRASRRRGAGLLALPGVVKRALTGFYVNALLNGLAVGMVMSVMIVYLLERIVASPVDVAAAMVVPGLAGLLASYPAARLMDRSPVGVRRLVLAASIAANRLAMASIGFTRSLYSFMAAASVMNVAVNIALPLMRSLEAGLVPAALRGRVFGLHQAFFNAGMAVGPLLGSALYEGLHDVTILPGVTGVEATFIVSAAVGLSGLPLLLHLYRPERLASAAEAAASTAAEERKGSPGHTS